MCRGMRPTGAMRAVLGILFFLASSSSAAAAGFNLFWNDCGLGPSAARNKQFACDTNEGAHILVGSFVSPMDLPRVFAMEAIIHVESESCPMTSWWQLKPGGACRQTALSAEFFPPHQQYACESFWQAQPIAGFSFRSGVRELSLDDREGRIDMLAAAPTEQGGSVSSGTEYFAFSLVINNSGTVGEGACAGCADPVCIEFRALWLYPPDGTPGGPLLLAGPDASQVAKWQGGTSCCGYTDCSLPLCTTPTRNHTWGQIKSLYR